ncbi:MAG: Maf family protein [Gammaproteobacteria bacterium]|jgi:septum formation protein|nr:septum formation inhibitor Maf [Chromatiales bacterium]MDP6674149.1 Maf family protein [Gammaproteobacteria bacterium]
MPEQFIYLASGSPRRRELLAQLDISFELLVTDIDESLLPDEPADAYVRRMARDKARAALERLPVRRAPVLGADTAVIVDRDILGKPADQAAGEAMLRCLSGRDHEVLTAVAISAEEHEAMAVSRTVVTFRPLSDAEIKGYWATGEPQDKAGGYAIQGLGAVFIAAIHGSYSGVMGLPLFETAHLLNGFGYRFM